MGDSHNEAEDIVADAIKLNSDDLNEKVCLVFVPFSLACSSVLSNLFPRQKSNWFCSLVEFSLSLSLNRKR